MNYTVLIPAYNASRTIGNLIERTLQYVPAEQIVVIDDGSTDATADIASGMSCRVLRHSINRGKGAALQTGFDYCLTQTMEFVVTIDADLQHKPEDIQRFIEEFKRRPNDIILGSRLHNTAGMPFLRKVSNTITTFLVTARTGVTISDSQSGFRLISLNVLRSVRMEQTGFEAETEFLIKAAIHGFTIGGLPIETVYAGEKSHMTHLRTTLNFIKVLLRQY